MSHNLSTSIQAVARGISGWIAELTRQSEVVKNRYIPDTSKIVSIAIRLSALTGKK